MALDFIISCLMAWRQAEQRILLHPFREYLKCFPQVPQVHSESITNSVVNYPSVICQILWEIVFQEGVEPSDFHLGGEGTVHCAIGTCVDSAGAAPTASTLSEWHSTVELQVVF
jgi:hypothetical protein